MRLSTPLLTMLGVPMLLSGAASISIVNGDDPGVGFNDPTPTIPIGGNAGTTLGQQRLIAFQKAAQIWGAALSSSVDIKVRASWPPLPCNAVSAVLGAAGANIIHANFPGAAFFNVWYPQALANKLSGVDLINGLAEDIVAFFNRDVGKPGCLTGRFFYLGLDGNAPANTVHFLPILLHELGHGLGFQSFTDKGSGNFFAGLPSIFDVFLLDKLTNQTWATTSSFVRAASAVNGQGKLVWDGANVKASVPAVLRPAPLVNVTAPSPAVTFLGGPSAMGASLATPVSGELMPVTSNAGGGNACAPLSGFDAAAVNGKVALIDRGVCGIDTKMLNAQNAGAKAVILVNNTPDIPPPNITVYNASVTIPNVIVSNADGTALKNSLRFRSRTNSGLFVTLNQGSTRAGADSANRAIMYAPAALSPGSSVSHFDISAARNLLMEPFTNVDLTLFVSPPQDLTLPFLKDLGW